MQALILVGGEGTRLRPLTSSIPKPVVTLVDRPFITYMLAWLQGHGVDDVILSCGFLASGVSDVLGDGSALGIRLRYVEEPQPLGTGGAVKFAQEYLDERFLMLNGDVLTDIDLSAQIALHERNGARATLALVPVEDPSAYGLVRLADGGAVRGFLEKPKPEEIDTDLINAGAYVLERDVLDLLEPGRPASIERDLFPRLVGDGLFGAPSDAYWLDIGTPERYLQGTFDILDGSVASPVRAGANTSVVGADGRIEPDAQIGPLTVLGAGVTVGAGAVVERSVVLDGAVVGAGCVLRDCVIGPGARIGDGTEITGQAMVGAGVVIGAGNHLDRGVRIFPGVQLPDTSIAF